MALCPGIPGEIATIWRRQKDVFATLPGHPREVRLGSGEQPWLAADERGVWLTWISRDGGDLFLLRPHHRKPEIVAHHVNDPVIAVSLTGKGSVVLAWEDGNRQNSQVRVLVIPVTDKP